MEHSVKRNNKTQTNLLKHFAVSFEIYHFAMRLALCAMRFWLSAVEAHHDQVYTDHGTTDDQNPQRSPQNHIKVNLRQNPVDRFAIQPAVALNQACRRQYGEKPDHPDEKEPVLEVRQPSAVNRPARDSWQYEIDRTERDAP